MGMCSLQQTILVNDANNRKGTGQVSQVRIQATHDIVHELQKAVKSFQVALDILSAKVAQETGASESCFRSTPIIDLTQLQSHSEKVLSLLLKPKAHRIGKWL